MGRIEKIIDITNTGAAKKQIREYFEGYSIPPRVVVACPGGYVRSRLFAGYLEANKLAICPFNVKVVDEIRTFTALGYNDLKFVTKNDIEIGASYSINKPAENPIDVVVLSGIPLRRSVDKIIRVVSEVPSKTPVIVLGGEEGNFLYFCQRVAIN